jgi:predicted RNase H-like HicB family nuclease
VKVVSNPAAEGAYWAEVLALPGCVTEGETREQLLANLRDAVEGVLLTERGDYQRAEEAGQAEQLEL